MWRTALIAASLVGGLAGEGQAQTVFEEGFENGLDEHWRGYVGDGDLRITEYAGNHSLRLTHDAWIARVVPVPQGQHIVVSAGIAADDLEPGDACRLEVSLDGESWSVIDSVEDGRDDAVTLHRLRSSGLNVTGRSWVAVRIRADGNGENDTCWADNIAVTAQVDPSALPQEIPDATFLGATMPGPVSAHAFEPSGNAAASDLRFRGRLVLSHDLPLSQMTLHRDEFNYIAASRMITHLPRFDIGLVSDGDQVIPVERGPQAGDHPDWEWIFQPGRIWEEADGTPRVSLPVALQERNANCIHNGWMSFRLDGQTASHAVVQFGAETCAYFQFDAWATLPVTFESGDEPAFDHALAMRIALEAARLPRQPFEGFPGIDASQVGSELEVAPKAMTVFGLVADGRFWSGGCNTRFGRDPFCDELAVPSYSLAKSIVAGLALMRLEALYPGAKDALIADYVPACSNWDDVTLEHALDMATGRYNSDGFETDEMSATSWGFLSQSTHAGRIERACSMFTQREPPGERWVYHTSDTYVLGAAMQGFLRQETGNANADIYDDLLRPIWRALGLGPLTEQTRRSYDAEAQPFTGWGLTLTADDIARIGLFLQAGGEIDGEAWLDTDLYDAAMQRAADDRGLATPVDGLRYQNGFWAWNAGPALGCSGDLWIPSMSGYGGLTVALLPNGHVYFYISDGRDFAWRRAAAASNAIAPFCEVNP